jgi:hypothetical protein
MSSFISLDDTINIKGAFKFSPYFDSTVFSFLESEGYHRAEYIKSKDKYYFKEIVNVKNQRIVIIIQGDAIYVYKNTDKLNSDNFIKMFSFDDYRSFKGTYNQMCLFVKEYDGC